MGKNEVFQALSKNDAWDFSDILHEVTTIHCVSKKLITSGKKNVKVEKKHCRISFCFWKVNVLPLVITLINNVKVSIEHVRCDSLKRYILSLFCISYVMSLFIKMRFITCSDSRTVIGNET